MDKTEIAYLAGLFDGEGNIQYKQYMRKRRNNEKAYPTWSIRMEVSMTDESIIRYIHEVLGVGTVGKRPPHKTSMGKKMQYRWRCGFRDAYYVCCLFWPYAHVKLPQIQKIIDHYGAKIMNDKVVNLDDYRAAMSLE
jgi:hypothetical protein|tara:strand:+ start:325 stop:735 length:411 start_codon:yes stop_codon:yes gene_type:complete